MPKYISPSLNQKSSPGGLGFNLRKKMMKLKAQKTANTPAVRRNKTRFEVLVNPVQLIEGLAA
jgi:hypothetical protein